MAPAAAETSVPVSSPASSTATDTVNRDSTIGKVTPSPVLETSSAIFPRSATPSPAVETGTTSEAGGSSSGSVTLALVVAGVVATVLAAAVFVYAKTVRRHEEIKNELESGSQRPPPTTMRASLHGPYQQLSPERPGYDAYAAGGGAMVAASGNSGPPAPSKARKASSATPRAIRSSSDQIDLNDPAFDVLTPLSDIAMVGGGYAESFQGHASGNFSNRGVSEAGKSSSGSVFYDPNQALSALYPGQATVVPPNDVEGSDSDSDSDVNDQDDIAPLSFDSQFDSSARGWDDASARGWSPADPRTRAESAFSIGSDNRESSFVESDRQHQQTRQQRQESVVSTGLHDHDASVSSYSEYLSTGNFSEYERSTEASEFSEYDLSERFNSTVFSDVGVGDTGIAIDESDDDDSDDDDGSYRDNSYADVVAPVAAGGNDGGHSFSSSSSDGDDIDGGYEFDDDDDGDFGSSSFSSTSSYEV